MFKLFLILHYFSSNTDILMILDHKLRSRGFILRWHRLFSLQLSEAYVLLWQNSSTGDVNGRQGSKNKIGGSVSAVLLDLIAMGKIKIEFEEKKFLFVKYTDIWVKVSSIEYILLSFFLSFCFLKCHFCCMHSVCLFGSLRSDFKRKFYREHTISAYEFSEEFHMRSQYKIIGKTVWMQRSTQYVNITDWFLLPDL